MQTFTKGIAIMGLLSLIGCAPSPQDYQDQTPKFDFKEYFTGPVKAHGQVENWHDKVSQRFDVTLTGTWQGDQGQLEEFFNYYDGRTQHRVWKLTKIDAAHYEATADDIVGVAKGEQSGNAIEWQYTMRVPNKEGTSTTDVFFHDWMFLMNDGALINRAYLSKFGISVGETAIMMQKQDASAPNE